MQATLSPTYITLYLLKSKGTSFTAILIYVDDILLTDNELKEIEHIMTSLLEKFLIKDLGNLKYFLGIEFSRSRK